jgi:hypothetical protein
MFGERGTVLYAMLWSEIHKDYDKTIPNHQKHAGQNKVWYNFEWWLVMIQ